MSKNIRDLYRGINVYMKAYHPETNLEKDENCDAFADSHNILNRQKHLFYQLWYVHWTNDAGHTEIHMSEPLITEPCFF